MRVLLFLVAWAALCAGAPAPPPPPLWYFAPVLSGGGYSTEAIALLHGLVNVLPADEKPSVAAVASRNGAFASFTTPAIAHGTHPASTTAAARSSECRAIVARHANALAAARGATPSSATALAADASSATLAAA